MSEGIQHDFEPDEKGRWPLHFAVVKKRNWPERVHEYVTELGHPVNAQDNDLNTPLHWAIWNRRVDMVAPLLELGADPNLANHKGASSLHHLFTRIEDYEDLHLLRQLLEHGADPTVRDKDGNTAYHMLALGTFRSAEAARRLAEELCYRCDLDHWTLRNHAGQTPMDCAKKVGKGHWLTVFLSSVDFAELDLNTAPAPLSNSRRSARL